MMLICLRLMEALKMQILIRKFFFAVLLCLGLCACSGNSPSSKMVSTKDAIQRKSEAEWNNPENDQAYSLNNKATFFGEYLLIN